MQQKIVAMLLVVTLAGCSAIPRAMPQSESSVTDVTTSAPEEKRMEDDAPATPQHQRATLAVVLLVLLGVLAYATLRSPATSFSTCCYK